MDDNKLYIEVGLDLSSDTYTNIAKDIETLNNNIRGKEQYMLKIGAKIDTDNIDYTKLQNQLTEIGKKVHINVGNVDIGNVKNATDAIKTNFDATFNRVVQDVNKANVTTSGFVATLSKLASDDKISKVQIADANEYVNAIGKIVKAIKDQGSNVKILDYNKYFLESGKNIDAFSLKVKNLNGEIATLNYALNKDKPEERMFSLSSITGDNSGIEKQIKAIQAASIESDKYKSKVIELTSALNTLHSKYTDPNAAKAITADEELIRLYDVAKSKIELVGSANKETFKSLVADAEAAQTAYQNYAKTLQAAQYSATNLRTKDLTTNIDIAKNNLSDFENVVRASKVPLQVMGDDLKTLSDKLSTIGKSSDFTEFLNQFDVAKSKFQSFKTLYTAIDSYSSTIDRMAEQWKKQGINIRNSDESLKQLKNDLQNIKTLPIDKQAEEFSRIRTEFEKLSNSVNPVVTKMAEYRSELAQTKGQLKEFGLYSGDVKKQIDSLVNSTNRISTQKGLEGFEDKYKKYNTQIQQAVQNLNAQVISQTKVYEIMEKMAKVNPAKNQNEYTNLSQQLAAEQQNLSNLQDAAQFYNKIIPLEERELYLKRATTDAENELATAYNKALSTANEGLGKIPTQIAAIESRFQTLTNKPEDLKNLIEQIKAKLGEVQGISEGDISSIKAKVTAYQELAKMVDEANNKTKKLATTQRSDDSAVLLSQKVQKLIQDVNAYINANQKAAQSSKLLSTGNTVQQEMNGIFTSLKNVSTTSEFNKINAHFRTMKSEIKATGLEGTTALGKLWENIKKFGGWMSITSTVTRVFMYIRRAITELKEIDTILTEISKTSDRTTQSLEKLSAASFDVASKYGQKASDYLKGVQEMSRAGFGETQSEQMAELSTLAQSAGDMTADLANQYLIATNAAYGLAGNTKELNKVLDSQNYITNHNALSMTDLAEATKLAASQAHASGIGIDELTAALGTMIAVTQQGGDTAARAFKGKRALSTNARYR